MIVEILLAKEINLNIEGYVSVEVGNTTLYSKNSNGPIDIVIKRHPDGKVSVFTDKIEVIKIIRSNAEILDIIPKP